MSNSIEPRMKINKKRVENRAWPRTVEKKVNERESVCVCVRSRRQRETEGRERKRETERETDREDVCVTKKEKEGEQEETGSRQKSEIEWDLKGPTYFDAIGVPRGVPDKHKSADQIAGFALFLCWWCTIKKKVDRINYVHYNVQLLSNKLGMQYGAWRNNWPPPP